MQQPAGQAGQGAPSSSGNAIATMQSTPQPKTTGLQQGVQQQGHAENRPGQLQGQFQASPPAASPMGQPERPFTAMLQGQPGIFAPIMLSGQPGGQDGAQAGAHAPEVPGNAALQPQPQLGSPQGAPGQPMKLSEAMLSQLHYHPPVGGRQRVQYQQYTSPPLTVQQIHQLQQLQVQQQQQLQQRLAQGQAHQQQPRAGGRDGLPRMQAGPPQSPPHASLPRAPLPMHMQQGLQPGARPPQPGQSPQLMGPGPVPGVPSASPGAHQPRLQVQMPRSTVVQHAAPMQLQLAQQMQAQEQQGPRPGQTPGSMPMVPSADGKASAAMTPVQNQTLQSPPRPTPRPSPKAPKVVTLAGPIKKHCNCKNSRCLKLYCECFASGRYCDNCNCVNCCNNKESEQVRQAAVEAILERNPNAFRPKIQGGEDGAAALAQGPAARHNKGCNCKKSGCLKKYCECFQASIFCSDNCKCIDCKNFEGSDAREMVMISLVHEHNRTMNAHHAAKRARLASTPTAPQPQLAGSAGGGSMAVQMGPRGAMPAIPGVLQAQQGPPGPMTALLQQEGPPPGLHPASGSMATPGASEGGSWPAGSMAQQLGASPMQSPRLGAAGSRQPLKPLVHSRTVLQETMREMVNRGGVAEMCSLLLLIGQETEQKMASRPAEAESAKAPADADADKLSPVAGSSSSGGGGDKPHSSYSGPSKVYAAQEKAVLQEFHFILKKISDRVLRKTAQEVEQTAAAKATASAALAAVPGNLVAQPGALPSPAPSPSPRMQQPMSSPSPSIQQSPGGPMRVLHIAQSPHAARPGAPQMPQQRMVNLSAYGRPGGPSPQSSPGLVQVQMGQARPPAGAASAPHQPWQILMQTGQLGPGGLPSQQGGPRPGTVMYSAPPGGAQQPPHSTGQSPVNIRLSNYSGPTTLILPSGSAPSASMQQPSLAPLTNIPSSSGGMAAAAGFVLPHQRSPASPQHQSQFGAQLPSSTHMMAGQEPGQSGPQPLTQMGHSPLIKQEQASAPLMNPSAPLLQPQ
ncbi:hypothetical protein CVIRNUC_008956 [Coccomyxa viridis]|uniref:CRC domain-containing protein n=1 Tax=Coccomyxa viridis TaxID=1274662 RepID=A0AAV1IHQ5_9CHLO|nr:hypothetical protein CVIRNUC_008956 [Coccomyxa viridis]